MTDPDDLTLRMLRTLEAKMDRLHDDMQDIKVRMTAVEEALAGVHRRIDRTEI